MEPREKETRKMKGLYSLAMEVMCQLNFKVEENFQIQSLGV